MTECPSHITIQEPPQDIKHNLGWQDEAGTWHFDLVKKADESWETAAEIIKLGRALYDLRESWEKDRDRLESCYDRRVYWYDTNVKPLLEGV